MSAIDRQKMLEHMYLSGVQNNRGLIFSVETLLDVLVVLFDECCSSNLRREKTVTEFVEYGEYRFCLVMVINVHAICSRVLDIMILLCR